MKPDLEPHPATPPPPDDLDKQVDDMLDALEQRADDLFDAVSTSPSASADGSLDDLADAIANTEDADPIRELAPDEVREHSGAFDSVIDEAVSEAPEALARAEPSTPCAQEPEASDPEHDELDRSIAQAVASAEDALDDEMRVDADEAELQDAVAQTDTDDQPTQEHEAIRSEHAAAQGVEAPDDAQPAADQGTVPAPPEPTPEPAPVSARAQVKATPWARIKPVAGAAWSRAKPITLKAGGASVRTMSRPLAMIDPALRDYVGYAAAVTAFMGLCVWVLALI